MRLVLTRREEDALEGCDPMGDPSAGVGARVRADGRGCRTAQLPRGMLSHTRAPIARARGPAGWRLYGGGAARAAGRKEPHPVPCHAHRRRRRRRQQLVRLPAPASCSACPGSRACDPSRAPVGVCVKHLHMYACVRVQVCTYMGCAACVNMSSCMVCVCACACVPFDARLSRPPCLPAGAMCWAPTCSTGAWCWSAGATRARSSSSASAEAARCATWK